MKAWEIDTAAKRVRLAPRKNPYWRGIAGGRGGVSLGSFFESQSNSLRTTLQSSICAFPFWLL